VGGLFWKGLNPRSQRKEPKKTGGGHSGGLDISRNNSKERDIFTAPKRKLGRNGGRGQEGIVVQKKTAREKCGTAFQSRPGGKHS